jgi:hypothetical protein
MGNLPTKTPFIRPKLSLVFTIGVVEANIVSAYIRKQHAETTNITYM